MQTEIEATFLDISHDALRSRLQAAGGVCEQPLHLMRRAVYDYADLRLDKQAAWIRVRQEADRVTMAFKQRQAESIDGMQEIEFEASSYNKACTFLGAIGLVPKALQESKREVWRLGECQIMLDEWPWIPPYVELEADSEAIVRGAAARLEFEYDQAIFDSTDAIYQKYFDVTRTEISTVPITFGVVPEWLEARRR